MDTVSALASFFEALLAHAHFVSILLGVAVSVGVTQLAKFPIRLAFYYRAQSARSRLTPDLEVQFHRWCVRAFAVVAAAVITFMTWPDGLLSYRLSWSIAAGVCSPMLYQIVTHWWPWLGECMTADRALPETLPPPAPECRRDDAE